MVRGIIVTLIYLAFLVAILFTSAGRVDWTMGWMTLGIYIVISILAIIFADRELLSERCQIKPGAKLREVLLASISFVFLFPFTLLISGLDVGRFEWSPSYHSALHVVALIVFTIGNVFALWAVISNNYFSTFVRIQKDRNHKVVTEGPYKYVRHPGYAGAIVAAITLPISLGSLWALIPTAIGVFGFGFRTAYEDRILLEELRGYDEYSQRVRFRLIPGVW